MRTSLLLLACSPVLLSQAPYQAPDDVAFRKADIYSEGTRLSAEVFSPKRPATAKLPSILMAHGWGGTASALRRDAAAFAREGYLVVTFDYRGWGASDSRIILAGPAPSPHTNRFTAEVQEVREVVDPLDMAADWFNALHWLAGEPQCDVNRIGLWGSSFSGGLVVYVAARDSRVKAIHSQVGSLDGRSLAAGANLAKTYEDASKRARGELQYPDPGVKVVGNLRGAPIPARFLIYTPVDDVNNAPKCAMQFLIAAKEELFDNREHAIKAYNNFKGTKTLVTIPDITHYGIYYQAWEQAHRLALDWFNKYLK